MGVQNTKELLRFIMDEDIKNIEDKADQIKKVINVFSEYLVAVNSDYVYNKTYLNAFADDFILCYKCLKKKYDILRKIIIMLLTYDMDYYGFNVCIDGAWTYRNGKIDLANEINSDYVKRDKIQIELVFSGDKGFVIAEELDISKEYDEELKIYISEFIRRKEELIRDKV